MSYTKLNYRKKCRHAAQITALHYEPGRQDRCHKWVWKKYIKDIFHVEYATYLRWLRDERKEKADMSQLTLF